MGSDQQHDRRLVTRVAAGDERAFDELVDRHRERLLRYVSRRFSRDLAEDAVQETLLAAHRALTAGAVPADVRAWLSTIAWRRALDMTRREREALPLDTEVAAGAAHEPEARVLQSSELGRVVAAFSELPERQRAALALSAFEGRSLEEIGSALDVPADTAKSLVARSRRTLTHRLAAAELCCAEARLEMEGAAERGVRLSGSVTLHLRSCRACKGAHREIRRRRRVRVALLIPFGLAVRTAGLRDRIRDLIAFNPAWEAQASAAKLCTAACLTAVGVGGTAAPAFVPTVVFPERTPVAAALVKPEKKTKPRKPKQRPKPTRTVVAQSTPVWTPTPVVTAAPTTAPTKKKKEAKHPTPELAAAGSAESGYSTEEWLKITKARPTPTATAEPTPEPTVAPAASPPPAGG